VLPRRRPREEVAQGVSGQGEAQAIWALWAVDCILIAITYARVSPAELYHTSHEGVAAGLSRALVLLNFPIAFVAVALVLIAVTALPRRAWWVAGPAIALCWLVAWPGVVDQSDLDARPVNTLPAIGVALALLLTVVASRRAGSGWAPPGRSDLVRLPLIALVTLVSLPWLAAELGFYFPGDVLMGEELVIEDDGTSLAAVHLGHHHGLDGALLTITALVLSRVRIEATALRRVLRAHLALMFVYGLANLVQDAWLEQLVKRGWVDWEIPSMLRPEVSAIWAAILAVAAAAYLGHAALRRHALRAISDRESRLVAASENSQSEDADVQIVTPKSE